MAGNSELCRVHQGEYTVYQREAMYCFIKGMQEDEKLTLESSFLRDGTFLFCPGEITDEGRRTFFIENGTSYLKRWNRNLLFLWIENPQDCFYNWRISFLEKRKRAQSFVFDGYRLCISAWESLLVQEEEFIFHYSKKGGYGFGTSGMVLHGNTFDLRLKAAGKMCGTFCGGFSVRGPEADQVMQRLDAGIRYSRIMDEKEPKALTKGFVSEAVNRLLIPVGDLNTEFLITPQSLFDAERTRIGLARNKFLTHFTAVTGAPLYVDAGEDAALVFQECPVFPYRNADGEMRTRKRLYLGIEGGFCIAQKDFRLLCGTSGTENILLKSCGNLRFCASMPSVAPFRETVLGTTSWVAYDLDAAYYCQPQDSVLYAALSEQGLRCLEVPAAVFEKEMPAVPMMPLWELDTDGDEEALVLDESLYQRRQEILSQSSALPADFRTPEDGTDDVYDSEQSTRAVTPQGVMAEVMQDGRYNWIAFAGLSDDEDVPGMRFMHVGKEFRKKLQQKEMMFVIDSAQEFERLGPSDGFCFSVEGMQFSLLPDAWREGTDSRTMIVFQYSASVCMKEALPDHPVLQKAVRNAYTKTGGIRDGYEPFINAVTDKKFQGFLALHVSVSMEDMPQEVQFLADSIDKERFCASYLIVSAGKIYADSSNKLHLARAEISGLADYAADDQLIYAKEPPDYDYLVRELKIQIFESRLLSFMSSSELLLNRLFEAEAVSEENSDGNCLVLQGNLVEKDGKRTYQFRLKQCVRYRLSGSAICDVWVQKADLVTDGSRSGKFLLSGVLSCRGAEGADLFGFGGEEPQEGLPFSQLVLTMYPAESGGRASFSVRYDFMNFDREKIVLREMSFPGRFAVQLESFLAECMGETPEEKGYSSITAPVLQGTPPETYQGFVWRADIGSLGELSGQSMIQLRILTAFWSGEDGNVQYYTGLKLPEIFSGDRLKLQGIFRLGFGSVSLEKEGSEYCIRLHNFHLEILGASFPKGNSDIFLFSDGEHVGWYAAYKEDRDELQSSDTADGAGCDESD